MANEARDVDSVLSELKTALTTGIPTAIDDYKADGGLEPSDPGELAVDDNPQRRMKLAAVRLMTNGETRYEHRNRAWVHLHIPIQVVVEMDESPLNSELSYRMALAYTRIVMNALSASWQSVTGAIVYRTQSSGVAPLDPANPRRRFAVIRGLFKVRTARVES